ncbi:fucolectin-2-like [Gigantopelta aegis]|uniref:fucolectin-2-like n=1 Tax=Gigantopelta aegis TaxID=1735272 RepID=UPI001B889EAB|nr:fucolectin-2-like [Gigantopelta aegis]
MHMCPYSDVTLFAETEQFLLTALVRDIKWQAFYRLRKRSDREGCVEEGLNVAKCSRAIQSSTWKEIYTADRAVDGNTGKRFYGDTCSHTDCKDDNPSWTLCLDNMQTVRSVTIHNPDKAKGRLKNIKIDVYTENPSNPGAVPTSCATIGSTPVADGISVKLDCPLNVVGRYIKISKTSTMARDWRWRNYMCDALVLCEVEVNATTVVSCPNGFRPFGGSCYFVSDSDVANWYEAGV